MRINIKWIENDFSATENSTSNMVKQTCVEWVKNEW